MTQKLMGIKQGMTQLFDDNGKLTPCTVIYCEPNIVSQIKTVEKDGYTAIQTACTEIVAKSERTKEKRAGKPKMGLFKAVGAAPRRFLFESRIDNTEEKTLGQQLTVEMFNDVKYVDVIGTSKGKGTQGVMKKHNYHGGRASHGSGFHRTAGSTGMCSSPGICFKGQKRAGRMGNVRVTTQNLEVVKIDVEKNLVIVKGAIPGAQGREVYIQNAVKK